jgi:hypothetical protein
MKRAREDRSLEVWVGGGRQLAGWLTTFRNVPMAMSDILVTRASVNEEDGIEETRGFSLTSVHQNFDARDLQNTPGMVDGIVPLYAQTTQILNRDAVRFVWKVLRLNQDSFDWLFDHPDFVPADTEKDRDYLASEEGAREYITEMLDQGLSASCHFGSVATYGKTDRSTSAATSSGSANDYCMTLEKLQKSIAAAQQAMSRR